MKIILTQDVPELGRMGEMREVADGYARNYLIPKGMAVPATPGAIKQVELKRKAEEKRAARLRLEAQELAQRLGRLTLTFRAKVGESERLYGSITSAHIVEAIQEQTGQAIDKRKVELEHPIRKLGEHQVAIKLMPDVTAQVRVVVEPEDEGREEE